MRELLKRLNGMLDRILGCLGGGVCAVAISLAAFYVCAVFQFHIIWLGFVSVVSLLLFSVLGLVLHRYFACFLIPIFNAFANAEGHAHCNDGHSGRQWIAAVGLLLALVGLLFGALFQIHVMFAAGALLFVGYAVFAPRVFPNQRG